MSDIMDRKLKKITQELKYDQVPFDGRHMKKTVLKSLRQEEKTPYKRRMLFPLLAVFPTAALLSLSYTESQTPMTASTLVGQTIKGDFKTAGSIEDAEFANAGAEHSTDIKVSKMIRATYIIHEGKAYIQTNKQVSPKQLHEVIGTMEHLPSAKDKLKSVPTQTTKTSIYSIKEEDPKEKIAVQSWRDEGTASTGTGKQGYYLFQNAETHPLPDVSP